MSGAQEAGQLTRINEKHFTAGQTIAIEAMRQITVQCGGQAGIDAVRGMFSGAMAILQASMGNDEVARFFQTLIDADKDHANATAVAGGIH